METHALVSLGPPYGPPANLDVIFRAWREHRMPASIGREWFEKIGLSPNLAPRNLHALRYLGLIDRADTPTALAERLRVAAGDDYPAVLEKIVRTAYASVFALRDPAIDPRSRLEDAFRHEKPSAQRARMVACFLGLCRQAAIVHTRDAAASARTLRAGLARVRASPIPSESPRPESTLALLVAKFPDFDPSWPDGVKERWFDNFGRLRDELVR